MIAQRPQRTPSQAVVGGELGHDFILHAPLCLFVLCICLQDVKPTLAASKRMPFDGATAAAYVAYAFSEQAFIYPITPATPLGDAFAGWNAKGLGTPRLTLSDRGKP